MGMQGGGYNGWLVEFNYRNGLCTATLSLYLYVALSFKEWNMLLKGYVGWILH